METPEQYTVLTLSKNVHPNTDGSPWGWIILDGSKIRFATWSGCDEQKRCEEMLRVYNQAKELIKENSEALTAYNLECKRNDELQKEIDRLKGRETNLVEDLTEALTYHHIENIRSSVKRVLSKFQLKKDERTNG